MESFLEGAENFYAGFSASPSVEYWLPSEHTSFFLSIGGGVGLTDSTGAAGGQGQDFTLNWFAQLGVRQALTKNLSLLGGAYFLHHSNGGQTTPNAGIDVLGITFGLGWGF